MWFSWFRRSQQANAEAHHVENVGADIPIRGAAEDLLSRTILATRIAQLLATPGAREGRVFAIRGGWGFGKTSLKNLVIEALNKASPKVSFLEFNPWQWGDADSIARALFGQMASRLGGAHAPDAKKRAKALRRYGGILVGGSGSLVKAGDDKGLSSWLNSAALVCAALGIGFPSLPTKILAAVTLGAAGLAMAVGRLLNWIGTDLSNAPLDEVREDLEARLRKLEYPLVIFVDDIDRLEPDQIRLLFRQIKVNANLPNLLFVLLFQPSIVERALAPVAGEEGRQFLEKIVQAHFDLPPVTSEKMFQIFGMQLSTLIDGLTTSENGFEQRRWGNIVLGGIQPFIRNLRDVNRLLTSIDMHLPMHRGSHILEVNILDFLALETLRVFEADFHAFLAAHKPLLLQSERFRGDHREQSDREAITSLLAGVADANRGACEAMLKELFPPVEWALGGSHYGSGDWARTWMREKRVCTDRSFDRYFMLQLPDGAMSESEFAALTLAVADPKALTPIVADLRRRDLLTALATRFDESVNELPLDPFDNMLALIVVLGEEMGRTPGLKDPFNTPFLSCWRAASWYLQRLKEPELRTAALLHVMEETGALAVPAVLISLDIDRRAKPENGDTGPAFDDEGLASLKQQWVTQMEARSAEWDTILENDQLVSHLYRWRDFSPVGIDAPRAWVQTVIVDDHKLARLLVRFLSIGSQQSWGDRVATKSESFRRDSLSDFFDLSDLENRLRRLKRADLDAEQRRVLELLDWHFDQWNAGKSTDR
ncbi:KAP family NTPase [Novosphingobium sp. G106]|uniref:KAP family P-loop NTPase fold protein n=1 Tax=Novosphingobium sp. G106 TaxID=2849500 RepID=UPI001C2DAF72|nr:P-loop NTPase fold protein [Novosphingobium sp. G106]MBV1690387.1 KAP family NTPase [Novosphingobium sp. G106]